MRLTINNTGGSGELLYFVVDLLCAGVPRNSLIDLCCNLAPCTTQLTFGQKVYIDVLPRIITEQDRFIQADVLSDHVVFDQHYDVATCLDGIEHLKKPDGFRLLEKMRKLADKSVLFTPLGDYLVDQSATNPEQHASGWLPDDVPQEYAQVIFPDYHPTLGIGAFFFWTGPDLEADYQRVKTTLAADPRFSRNLIECQNSD